jgi:hypothetical protein
LKELAGFKSLQSLDLSGTSMTDVGLKELAGLKSLQTLDLNPLTDKALGILCETGRLHVLERAKNKGGGRPIGEDDIVTLRLS